MSAGVPIIRTVVVDDEAPARELLGALLQEEAGLEVVAVCASGREAVAAIEQHVPNLVLLDVQMPGLDGFDVLAQARPAVAPHVVFVTGFDQYAVQAFEIHALDYVLKPVDGDRLRLAVQRVRERIAGNLNSVLSGKLLALLNETREKLPDWNRLPVRENNRVLFIDPEEIDWVEAEGNYVRLHVGKKSHLSRETMQGMEKRLARLDFVRVSRSCLVNFERVREWQPLFHGDSVLILHDGQRLTATRAFRDRLDGILKRLG